MSVDPPRHLPPTPEERLKIVVNRMAGGSGEGSTRNARPVQQPMRSSGFGGDGTLVTGDTTGFDDAVAIVSTAGSDDTTSAQGSRAVAIGTEAHATAGGTVAIGDADASATNAIAIGPLANASAVEAVAIGYSATASGGNSAALGPYSSALGNESVAAGVSSEADGGCVAFGFQAKSYGTNSIAIGTSSQAGSRTTGAGGIAIGISASATFDNSVAIGYGASAAADNEIAIGNPHHITVIRGMLVMADIATGLHQIVVSTSGALSTVPYP